MAGSHGAFGGVLTLPGIASIVLTIGMTIDANVLVYERIREELKEGHTQAQAVRVCFDRARSPLPIPTPPRSSRQAYSTASGQAPCAALP